jgi:hypothetical protein
MKRSRVRSNNRWLTWACAAAAGLLIVSATPLHGQSNTDDKQAEQKEKEKEKKAAAAKAKARAAGQPADRSDGKADDRSEGRSDGRAGERSGDRTDGRSDGAPAGRSAEPAAAGANRANGAVSRPAEVRASQPARVQPVTVIRTPNGGEIRRAPNGVVRDVRARGFDIHHGPGGVRVVRVERPDHVVIVTSRPGFGYVQRPYVFRDQALIHRTYFVNGVAYARVYRPYTYRGVVLTVYAPSRYYSPVFYTWAYTPWGVPVVYGWGWGGQPWYGYYGGYFAPYPVYAGPAYWLTDYLLATTLELAYQERMNAAAANAQANYAPTPLTPEVKQAISAEVQQQLEQHRAGRVRRPSPRVRRRERPRCGVDRQR